MSLIIVPETEEEKIQKVSHDLTKKIEEVIVTSDFTELFLNENILQIMKVRSFRKEWLLSIRKGKT